MRTTFPRNRWTLTSLLGLATISACSDGGTSASDDGSTGASDTTSASSPESTSPSTTASESSSAVTSNSDPDTGDDPSATESDASGTDPSTTDGEGSSSTGGDPDCHPLIAEVFFDGAEGDDLLQWVRLWNPCNHDIDLGAYRFGWGPGPYASGQPAPSDLDQPIIPAGGCWIVGGETSSPQNGDPDFDVLVDFQPNLENAEFQGGGFGIFLDTGADLDPSAIPIDAVIYGPDNAGNLIDETGAVAAAPYVASPGPGGSIQRTDAAHGWQAVAIPTPGVCPPF